MLNSNTIAFCSDVFGVPGNVNLSIDNDASGEITNANSMNGAPFAKQALLISKKVWDCSKVAGVEGFVASVVEPDKTSARFLFKISNKYYKLKTTGALEQVTPPADLTADFVLSNGNSAAQLNALNAVDDFVGKKIYPIIALSAINDAEDMPRAKISLKVVQAANVLSKTSSESDSPIWILTDSAPLARIINITPDTSITGDASVDIQVRLRGEDDADWSAYMDLSDAIDKECAAVQFKITYKVSSTDGTDSARLNWISVEHTFGQMLVAEENADLYTVVQDYSIPLQMCHVTIKHSPLIDSKISAYVNFMRPKKHREFINIGKANGKYQEFVLGESSSKPDKNIDASSIQLYRAVIAGFYPLNDFAFNSETSTVALTARSTTQIYASYDYDHGTENWQKMTLIATEPYNNSTGECASHFVFSLPDSDAADKTISNVRITITRPTGSVKKLDLGASPNAKTLPITLAHLPKTSSISFSDENVQWSYPDEDSYVLHVVAPIGTPRIISYSWRGEPVTIHSIVVGWSIA